MDSKVDGNLVPQLRTCIREKGKGKAFSLHGHFSMGMLLAGFLGKSAVSGFIQPDHSTRYWKRSPGRCLALVSECREGGEERMSTVPCCTWLRSQEVILLEQRCEKTVRTRPGSGGKSMSLKHTVFHLHHSFFLTSLVTHQENAWPATPCTKYNSA